MEIQRTESENNYSRQLLKQWDTEHKALMSLTMELHGIQYNPDIVGSDIWDSHMMDLIVELESMLDKKIMRLKRKAESEMKKMQKDVI